MRFTPALADEDYCYLTTKGRNTGRPHTIEIWFALHHETLYLLSGGGHGADWVKNIRHAPEVTVRIGDVETEGRARVVGADEDDALPRRLLFDKYAPRYSGDLVDWRRTALPVAIDISAEQTGG